MNISDEKYMLRCLELAQNGLGSTYPNPLVGSVIVHHDRIIGEGWHQKSGDAHAEVIAINSVKNKELLSESTLYVNLEPCSHFGKTPPCSDLIIQKKIKRVVVGCTDPFEKVSGRGISRLQSSGCEVVTGVLEEECKILNKRFFTFHTLKRPYIILKWAQTADGFIAPSKKEKQSPVWISSWLSRQLCHKWRSEEQAILVGKNTILADNPMLTTRDWAGQNPLRIVIGTKAEIQQHFSVFNQDATTILFSGKDNNNFQNSIPKQVCDFLFSENRQSLIVEGGSFTLQQFIDANLWDEARIFVSNTEFQKGISAPKIQGFLHKKENIGTDELFWYKNPSKT